MDAHSRHSCCLQAVAALKAARSSELKDWSQDVLYEIVWAASTTAQDVQQLSLASDRMARSGVSVKSDRGVDVLASALSVTQQLCNTQAVSMAWTTSSAVALPVAPTGHVKSPNSSVRGLLRSMAVERSDLAITMSDVPMEAPLRQQLFMAPQHVDSLQPPDGYGRALSASTMYEPVLLHSTARSAPKPYHWVPQPQVCCQRRFSCWPPALQVAKNRLCGRIRRGHSAT